jgi:hypothetical protein
MEGEYHVNKTSAEYDGVTLRVWRAETEIEAMRAFDGHYDYLFEVSGFASGAKTPWWFTFEDSGTSGLVWHSGVWVFGVEAGNGETRNQAAAEWVRTLKGG